MTTEDRIEITHFKWGPVGEDGLTDAMWFYVSQQPDKAARILGYSTGPETEKLYGHYDYEFWIDVSADQQILLIGLLAGAALDGKAPETFDDLKSACDDWGIDYTEGERDAAPDMRKNS